MSATSACRSAARRSPSVKPAPLKPPAERSHPTPLYPLPTHPFPRRTRCRIIVDSYRQIMTATIHDHAAGGTLATRPGRAELEAARDRTIPDVLPGLGEVLRVLFCGINPSLYSAATGWHFARPGNRFWPALHLSGFTPGRLAPAEQHLLPGYGLGITNLVARATAQASELDPAELLAGAGRLSTLVQRHQPRILAIAGVTAYRTAFGHPRAVTGPQPPPLDGPRVWVLPNPSGLNALWSGPRIVEAFRELREAVDDAT